jgi:CheY-like chemotaxis protein
MTSPGTPKRVLFVDDERAFLRGISSYLRTHEGYEVHMAVNGVQALEILRRHEVDAVVTDLHMPVMDGFALLARLREAYPSLPVLVMTAYATPEALERMAAFGSIPVLEKPLMIEDLIDELEVVLADRAQGYLRGISVASLLQLLEMERKTVTLEVERGAKRGTLSFREGRLIDAATGAKTGDAAAMEIIGWDAATVRLDAGGPPPRKTVVSGLHFLMMESARLIDEGQSAEDVDLGPLSPMPVQALEPVREVTPAQREALQALAGDLTALGGVAGAAFLTSDARVLASQATGDLDAFEAAATSFARLAATAHDASKGAGLGGCGEITLGTVERLVVVQSPVIADAQPLRVVVVVEWGCDQTALGRRLGDVVPKALRRLATPD